MFTRKTALLIVLTLTAGALLITGSNGSLIQPVSLPLFDGHSISAMAAPSVETLFSEDFESGTLDWNLDAGWATVSEVGNTVLEGSGHTWAILDGGSEWTDYVFETRVKRISGALQLMFRLSDEHGRYIVGVTPGGMYLRREAPWGDITSNLVSDTIPFSANTWYTLRIEVNVNQIQIFVDGSPRLNFTDPLLLSEWPLWQGTIGLEVTVASQARFDDVSVVGVPNPEATWERTGGPMGGLGYDVRYGTGDTQIMYVTDNFSGVYKSANNGQTWFPTNRGITGRFWPSGDAIPVFTLNVDPNNPNNLWAGLKDVKGAYKSIDTGQTWTEVTPVMTDTQFVFRGFTVMPGNSNEVFASGELPMNITGKEFGLVKGRIYHTEDGGQNWTKIWEDENLTRYVIVHPEDHNVIYVSLGIFDREANDSDCKLIPPVSGNQGTGGVLRGVRNGSTWEWTLMNDGLTDMYVGSLVMHPSDPQIMLAGAGNVACSRYWVGDQVAETGGVFLTTNGGESWTKTLTEDIITSVEFSPNHPNIAYAGGQNKFYISENGGETWVLVAGETFPWGPPGILAGFPIDILVDPEDPGTLFANNYGGGNVKSSDGGSNWELASKGYTGAMMFDISVHPGDPGVVYATARSGAFRSMDGGETWSGMAYPPANFAETYSVGLSPHTPKILLVAHELMGKLWRTLDGGDSWELVKTLDPVSGLNMRGFKRIVFAPSAPHVVYAGSCRSRGELHGGKTDALGIFKSEDTGQTWLEANSTNTEDECVNDLAVHPNNHFIVYAATAAEGLYKTTDGGVNWTPMNTGLPTSDIRSVAIDPGNWDVVYVGTEGHRVYKSTTGGGSWSPLVAGMEPNDSIWALAIDPLNPAVVYAGSFFSGVYRWNVDEGLWSHINDGLRTRSVTDLAISHDGSVLYAATWGEGVYRLGGIPSWMVYLPAILR